SDLPGEWPERQHRFLQRESRRRSHRERQTKIPPARPAQSRAHPDRARPRLARRESRCVERQSLPHPDPRRDAADGQRAVDRRVVFALETGGTRSVASPIPAWLAHASRVLISASRRNKLFVRQISPWVTHAPASCLAPPPV